MCAFNLLFFSLPYGCVWWWLCCGYDYCRSCCHRKNYIKKQLSLHQFSPPISLFIPLFQLLLHIFSHPDHEGKECLVMISIPRELLIRLYVTFNCINVIIQLMVLLLSPPPPLLLCPPLIIFHNSLALLRFSSIDGRCSRLVLREPDELCSFMRIGLIIPWFGWWGECWLTYSN